MKIVYTFVQKWQHFIVCIVEANIDIALISVYLANEQKYIEGN